MAELTDLQPHAPKPPPRTPAEVAALSVFLPGLGQLMQGRWLTAALQFGTVVTYLFVAGGSRGSRAIWLAVLWNAWSAIDAYVDEFRGIHEREQPGTSVTR
jgi:hypothetical protein